MENIHNIQHDLKKDIHNILNVLKFIKEDEEIKDPELLLMLNKNLERESDINQSLNTLDEYIGNLK
ncbi:MAG: hypothetical protein CMJ16_03455 [Peredibacter sp.]|nr:hypothetical protein [Peredibacter sp.]